MALTASQRKQLRRALEALHASVTTRAPARIEPNRTDEAEVGGRRGRAAAERDAPGHRLQPESVQRRGCWSGSGGRWRSWTSPRTRPGPARSAGRTSPGRGCRPCPSPSCAWPARASATAPLRGPTRRGTDGLPIVTHGPLRAHRRRPTPGARRTPTRRRAPSWGGSSPAEDFAELEDRFRGDAGVRHRRAARRGRRRAQPDEPRGGAPRHRRAGRATSWPPSPRRRGAGWWSARTGGG